jgi:hypothetical protein
MNTVVISGALLLVSLCLVVDALWSTEGTGVLSVLHELLYCWRHRRWSPRLEAALHRWCVAVYVLMCTQQPQCWPAGSCNSLGLLLFHNGRGCAGWGVV